MRINESKKEKKRINESNLIKHPVHGVYTFEERMWKNKKRQPQYRKKVNSNYERNCRENIYKSRFSDSRYLL